MSFNRPDIFASDLPPGFDGVFEWDYLVPAFQEATGRRITPMDIDAHVEIGGHHLIFETKEPGVKMPGGQVRALAQLWAKGYTQVVFLWGKREPIKYAVWYPSGRKVPWTDVGQEVRGLEREQSIAVRELQEIVFKWATWANGKPCPFQYDGHV